MASCFPRVRCELSRMTNNDKAGRRNMSGNKLHEIIWGGEKGAQSACPFIPLYRGIAEYIHNWVALLCTKHGFEALELQIHVNTASNLRTYSKHTACPVQRSTSNHFQKSLANAGCVDSICNQTFSLWCFCTRSRKIMFLASRTRPVHWADNLTAICEPIA
jgi:hypothetical protein